LLCKVVVLNHFGLQEHLGGEWRRGSYHRHLYRRAISRKELITIVFDIQQWQILSASFKTHNRGDAFAFVSCLVVRIHEGVLGSQLERTGKTFAWD
jgi:hypothetical protein